MYVSINIFSIIRYIYGGKKLEPCYEAAFIFHMINTYNFVTYSRIFQSAFNMIIKEKLLNAVVVKS